MKPIVGIDLGTTTSAIAYIKDHRPVIIPHQIGGYSKNLILSLVGLVNGVKYVGDECRHLAESYPRDIVREIKRQMGTSAKVKLGQTELSPQEVSALILKKLKEDAEDYLGSKIEEAIISVPAHFSPNAKHATIEAGELAGLKVERVIFEPTAAALAYGIENREKTENIIVFDLGGGTFDVSILESHEGVFEVKATGGDQKLGGKDFDDRLTDFILKDMQNRYQIDLVTEKPNSENETKRLQWLWQIRNRCEEAKISLSTYSKTEIRVPFLGVDSKGNPIEYRRELERDEFESLVKDILGRSISLTQKTLEEASLKPSDIDRFLLVGGSTKVPMVARLIKEKLGFNPKREINQDEAVVLGAAIQAGIKGGSIGAQEGIILTDICPQSLGVAVMEWTGKQFVSGVFDKLIKKGTVIPFDAAKNYQTTHDNQESVNIRVYVGESPHISGNSQIGAFELYGIPPAPAGEEEIKITFSYDINGNLQVRAKIISTGIEGGKDILLRPGQLSDEEKKQAQRNVEAVWEKNPRFKEVRSMIRKAEEKLMQLEDSKKSELQTIISNLKKALVNKNDQEINELHDSLTDFLFELED